MYNQLHAVLAEKIPAPTLILYLRAQTDTLMRRIALRDRSYERSMDRGYIDMVNRAYDDYFLPKAKDDGVLVIESDDLDFVHDEEDLRNIENLIRQQLQMPPYQPGLPIEK